jgi:hypothetical protein
MAVTENTTLFFDELGVKMGYLNESAVNWRVSS